MSINQLHLRLLILLNGWLIISSGVIAILFYLFPAIPPAAIGVKDVPIYLLFFGLIAYSRLKKNALKVNFVLFFVLLYLGASFVSSPAETFPKFASIRQLISFFILVFIGISLARGEMVKLNYYRSVVTLGLYVTIFGLVELSLGLWEGGMLVPFFSSKSIGSFESGMPFFFYEPVPVFLSGIVGADAVRRMVSTLLDPINLGSLLVFWISILLFNKGIIESKVRKNAVLLIFSLGLFATFSKGAWVQLFLILTLYNSRYVTAFKINLAFRVLIVLFLSIAIPLSFFYVPGVAMHLGGLVQSIQSMSLFGFGVGAVGNYAAMFGQNFNEGIGDSFLALLIGQLGIVGTVFWIWCFLLVIRLLPPGSYLKAVIGCQFIVAVLSENAFNLLSISGASIAIGLEISSTRQQNQETVSPLQLRSTACGVRHQT